MLAVKIYNDSMVQNDTSYFPNNQTIAILQIDSRLDFILYSMKIRKYLIFNCFVFIDVI